MLLMPAFRVYGYMPSFIVDAAASASPPPPCRRCRRRRRAATLPAVVFFSTPFAGLPCHAAAEPTFRCHATPPDIIRDDDCRLLDITSRRRHTIFSARRFDTPLLSPMRTCAPACRRCRCRMRCRRWRHAAAALAPPPMPPGCC